MGIIMIIIICKEANKVGIFQSNSRATGSSSSTAAFLGPNPSSSSSSSSSSESTFFSMLYCEKVSEIFRKLQEEPIEYWGGGYLVCSHLLSASLRSFHGIKYNRHTVLSKFGLWNSSFCESAKVLKKPWSTSGVFQWLNIQHMFWDAARISDVVWSRGRCIDHQTKGTIVLKLTKETKGVPTRFSFCTHWQAKPFSRVDSGLFRWLYVFWSVYTDVCMTDICTSHT